jgi:hypothetical protein
MSKHGGGAILWNPQTGAKIRRNPAHPARRALKQAKSVETAAIRVISPESKFTVQPSNLISRLSMLQPTAVGGES